VRSSPSRTDGYASIRDYAVIGDGRTVALIARDGAIDWCCLPDQDSPSVFGALLDAAKGGCFRLAPDGLHTAERRYVPGTNVLETTFRTATGVVRVTDAMTLPAGGLVPERELARKIEGVAGTALMRWEVEPRFSYGSAPTTLGRRYGIPVATAGADAVAVCAWDAGEPIVTARTIAGSFETNAGSSATVALVAAHDEPLVFPTRREVEDRLEATTSWWRQWTADRRYDGSWRDAVLRSALLLKLLVYAPSGAVAASPTTSLPEAIGGERNWDYRFCWIRDSAFTMNALLSLGCTAEADAFFWWLMHAAQLTHPRLQVLYRLNGDAHAPERVLPLSGYRGSVPVRVGNGAVDQLQLDIYGDLLQTAWLYRRARGAIDGDLARRLADVADYVTTIWRQRDAGLWEVRGDPRHFTQSKMMCWIALDRACALAATGDLPSRSQQRWRHEADVIRQFIEERCWSERRRSYAQSAGSDDLDAGLLLGSILGYRSTDDARMDRTVDAVVEHLSDGRFVSRYHSDDGLTGSEGAFIACSFWLVEALARRGRRDEAVALMESLLVLANDVGLFAEEADPSTDGFLGNFPQGLSHLALVNAAVAIEEAIEGGGVA
jgi:GH15 family glucan-1,4-alpha-glucosidase